MKFPRYTLLLCFLTAAFYFIFSSALLYIPTKTLMAFGFSFSNLLGIITYSFVHIGPNHVFGNVLLLFIIGFIAEQKLKGKDLVFIYLLSGAVAAIVFAIMRPETVLVGASAAVSGLIAVAFFVDIKKAVFGMLIFTLLVFLIGPPLLAYSQSQFELLKNRTTELEQEYNQALGELEEAIRENETERIENLSIEINKTIGELNITTHYQLNVEQGIERERESRTSPWVHLFGALTGLAYIFVFRRDIIWSLPSQLIPPTKKRKSKRGKTKKK